MLVRTLVEPKFEATIDKHTVSCEVEREKDKAEIRFSLAPKVSFEGGEAVKAIMNWGPVEAPTLIKGAMWTATATDKTFNVLQSSVVDDINAFSGERCEEVKADWQK